MNFVQVRLYAAARSAAGESEIMAPPETLKKILRDISIGNTQLERVFDQCSFLIDGVVCHDVNTEISAGSTVDVLPPFAGG